MYWNLRTKNKLIMNNLHPIWNYSNNAAYILSMNKFFHILPTINLVNLDNLLADLLNL